MRRRFVSVVLSLVACAATAADGPRALVERTLVDFGQVAGPASAYQDVRIRNAGTTPLRVERVELTPPLRLAGMRAQVAPGESATLRLALDPAGLSGPYAGRVVAYTNDAVEPEIELSVVGEVQHPLLLAPHAEFFLVGVRGERAEAAIDIIGNEAEPLQLAVPQHSNTRFTTRLHTIEPGRHYRLSIALRPDGPTGRQHEDITLATSSKAVPVLTVPAHTVLRERVYTFPDAVDLGALPLSAIQRDPALLQRNAQILMVYQSGGRDFRVAATSDIPGLSIQVERGPAGDRHQLTLRLDPARATAARDIRGSVRIETNDPGFPELRVPVTGALLAL